jgi:hypothetical protein
MLYPMADESYNIQNTNEFFTQSSSDVLKHVTFATSAEELIKYICFSKDDLLVVDYRYFKHIASHMSYQLITIRIIEMVDCILASYPKFTAHICIKTLTVSDIDKHMGYIKTLSNALKARYQDKMLTCSVHNAPFIFAQIYGIVSCFIDKDTQAKITLVKKKG